MFFPPALPSGIQYTKPPSTRETSNSKASKICSAIEILKLDEHCPFLDISLRDVADRGAEEVVAEATLGD